MFHAANKRLKSCAGVFCTGTVGMKKGDLTKDQNIGSKMVPSISPRVLLKIADHA